ncbi:hypothetical protein ALC56_11506 [Trachymyrmex septentrionalis]|uniref:Uncharacterized protein n=1 Tax=Trachymyrmex septentrionalis TaxID=34720 RepID=A0A195F1Q7_9HYME|nr:hypothetical protein ALC56_11506 [Trachymyrmex septentrionalis]
MRRDTGNQITERYVRRRIKRARALRYNQPHQNYRRSTADPDKSVASSSASSSFTISLLTIPFPKSYRIQNIIFERLIAGREILGCRMKRLICKNSCSVKCLDKTEKVSDFTFYFSA